MFRLLTPHLALVAAILAQSPKPFQTQSSSSINFTTAADGSQTIEIRNVIYEVITNVPGRRPDDRLVLRKTVRSKEVFGDIGVQATVTLEAWRFGDDLKQKPLYTLNTSGTDGHTMDNALLVVSRGLEEVEWWSAYKLGSGQHLFDTYVPLVSFSISRDTVTTRYVGLEVPPDDTKDVRLKQPNVVAVLTYATDSRVVREALLTSDDRQQAQLLRSFADETRSLSVGGGPGKGDKPAHIIKLSFTQNYPSPPNPVEVLIPVVGDDLDLPHAQLPARIHASAWKR
jgi:hypothetical protein